MRIWSFISQKGGSGKSTLSTQLAVYGTQLGERVILLDLDPQASAKAWHVLRGDGESPAVLQALPDRLRKVVAAIKESEVATLVIIDTAPHNSLGAGEAARVADLILCPTKPSMFDVAALKDTVQLLEQAGTKHKALGLINCVLSNGASKSYTKAAEAVAKFGLQVAKSYVGDRVAFIRATDVGKGVTEMAAKSGAAKDIQKLWAELDATRAGLNVVALKEVRK
jgi:chromosome partitioning protein